MLLNFGERRAHKVIGDEVVFAELNLHWVLIE